MTERDDTEPDDTVLTLVGESFDGVRMDRDADGIVARGRALRRRRRTVPALAAAGVAAVTTLAVALPSTETHGSAGVSASGLGSAGSVNSARQNVNVNVDLAAWSVHTNADSTITLTMRQLYDADLLRQVLANAGVRADVQYVSVDKQLDPKKGDQPSALSLDCVPTPGVHTLPQTFQVLVGTPPIRKLENGDLVMTIRRSAMPAGSVLSFVIFDIGRTHVKAARTVLLDGMPQKCVLPTSKPTS